MYECVCSMCAHSHIWKSWPESWSLKSITQNTRLTPGAGTHWYFAASFLAYVLESIWVLMKRGNWATVLPRIREPVRAGARNSPQQDSWALIRQRDRGRASPPIAVGRLISPQALRPLLKGMLWAAGDLRPGGAKAVTSLKSGQKAALADPFFCGSSLTGYILVKNLPGPGCWLFAQGQCEAHRPAWWED